MRQSREERNERRHELHLQAIDARSPSLVIEELPEIEDVHGLTQDLDAFVGSHDDGRDDLPEFRPDEPFRLAAYRAAIAGQLSDDGLLFSEIAQLTDRHRLDRVRRFTTLVFMEHTHEVILSPFGQTDILVMPR